jgi:hypothetical protein
MDYRVDRIYVANIGKETERHAEPMTYQVTADSAAAGALEFIRDENARLFGTVNELPGDRATATAWLRGLVYVIFVSPND